MIDYPSNKKIVFSIIFAFIFLFISCSDSDPKIANSEGFVVFDYSSTNALPSMKLSVFVETESDAHRVDSISISSVSSNFSWIVDYPIIICDEKKQWVGYSNFSCPNNIDIPIGFYNLVYTDAEEKKQEGIFSISYPVELKKISSSDVYKVLNENYTEKIAIFDESDVLIYFGTKNVSWDDDKKIFSANKNSFYYRICLEVKDTSAICELPPVYKDTKK